MNARIIRLGAETLLDSLTKPDGFLTVAVGGKQIGQDFEGNIATELGVPRTIDLAHSPDAKRAQDFIRAEANASGKGHAIEGRAWELTANRVGSGISHPQHEAGPHDGTFTGSIKIDIARCPAPITTNWAQAVGGSGPVGMLLGWTVLGSVFFYARRLRNRGVLAQLVATV